MHGREIMDIYTVLGHNQSPKKLRSFGDRSEFYCYFPPPLPDIIVVFCSNWPENMPAKMSIQLHLDSEEKSICKRLGEICRENMAFCYVGNWESDECILSNDILEKGRLIKLAIDLDSCANIDLDSQDSGIKDIIDENHGFQFGDHGIYSDEAEKENRVSKVQRKFETSPVDTFQVQNRKRGGKRKSVFAFDDEPASANIKHARTNCHNEELAGTCSNLTPTSKKMGTTNFANNSTSQSKTPRKKDLDRSITKSPATPGFHETIAPTPRWGHSFSKTDEHKAFIIGGQGIKNQISKDSIWQYDFSNNSFERIKDESNGASRRIGHTATYDEKSALLYVFGGSKHKKWFSDIHTLDTKTMKWVALQTTGKAPVRAYHSCTLLHYELLVFGGVFPNPDPIPDGCSNDVHIFNTNSNSWYKPIVNGAYPKARSGHSACLVDGFLYIFGGWDAPTCFNDLWVLDTGLMSFKQLDVAGDIPSPRSWHGTALSSNQQNIIIHGGYDGNIALNDIHIFQIPSKTWTLIGDGNHAAIAGHKLLTFRKMDEVGKKKEKTIVFGGGDNEGNFYNDIVEVH